jgi:hypothetical protein
MSAGLATLFTTGIAAAETAGFTVVALVVEDVPGLLLHCKNAAAAKRAAKIFLMIFLDLDFFPVQWYIIKLKIKFKYS